MRLGLRLEEEEERMTLGREFRAEEPVNMKVLLQEQRRPI